LGWGRNILLLHLLRIYPIHFATDLHFVHLGHTTLRSLGFGVALIDGPASCCFFRQLVCQLIPPVPHVCLKPTKFHFPFVLFQFDNLSPDFFYEVWVSSGFVAVGVLFGCQYTLGLFFLQLLSFVYILLLLG
jgi:hypothetical protein